MQDSTGTLCPWRISLVAYLVSTLIWFSATIAGSQIVGPATIGKIKHAYSADIRGVEATCLAGQRSRARCAHRPLPETPSRDRRRRGGFASGLRGHFGCALSRAGGIVLCTGAPKCLAMRCWSAIGFQMQGLQKALKAGIDMCIGNDLIDQEQEMAAIADAVERDLQDHTLAGPAIRKSTDRVRWRKALLN